MPGSYANPVILDPFRTIIEVGWPRNGPQWLMVYVTMRRGFEEDAYQFCPIEGAVEGGWGPIFSLERQKRMTRLYYAQEPPSGWWAFFDTAGSEVFPDEYLWEPANPTISESSNTIDEGTFGPWGAPDEVNSGSTPSGLPSGLVTWLEANAFGSHTDWLSGSSATLNENMVAMADESPQCTIIPANEEFPDGTSYLTYRSIGRASPTDDFVTTALPFNFTLPTTAQSVEETFGGVPLNAIFEYAGFALEITSGVNVDAGFYLLYRRTSASTASG